MTDSNLIRRFNVKVNIYAASVVSLIFNNHVNCQMSDVCSLDPLSFLKKNRIMTFRGCVNDESIVYFYSSKALLSTKPCVVSGAVFNFNFPFLFFVHFQSNWVTTFRNIN